ncbi:hypothetical protein LJB95_03180 [Paludibacteraceae bacterium OttesenSCG-928-F17]|nr:hypothetical protein [Paludibacteraceae bacterium OttesenSCG-928-F17]
MAAKTIYWGDGTTDKITVQYTGTGGVSNLLISSDPNNSINTRSKRITVKSADGSIARQITITQKGRKRAYSKAYNKNYK